MKREDFEKAGKVEAKRNSCEQVLRQIDHHFEMIPKGDGWTHMLKEGSPFLSFGDLKIDGNDALRKVLGDDTQEKIYNILTGGLKEQIEKYKKEFDSI